MLARVIELMEKSHSVTLQQPEIFKYEPFNSFYKSLISGKSDLDLAAFTRLMDALNVIFPKIVLTPAHHEAATLRDMYVRASQIPCSKGKGVNEVSKIVSDNELVGFAKIGKSAPYMEAIAYRVASLLGNDQFPLTTLVESAVTTASIQKLLPGDFTDLIINIPILLSTYAKLLKEH